LIGGLMLVVAVLGGARADAATYSATQTIPVPPASNFSGSGGGDGWAIEHSPTEVFNVFHHQPQLRVACHKQADASECYPPRQITDGGNEFSTNGHPEMHLDQATGKLYVYATRSVDDIAGVVCVDTTIAATNPNPFCGFTGLTPAGEGPDTPSGTSGTSIGMLRGTRWYAFNYVNGTNVSGARNKLLCFDVETKAACAGQPYDVAIGAGTVSVGGFPEPSTAAIGSRLIIPIDIDGQDRLACFDTATMASCGGAFPVTLGFPYAADRGSPFPRLDTSGTITGFCLPATGIPCFDLSGNAAAIPAGITSAITPNSQWNGPAVTIGPRVYVANGNIDDVECFSFASGAACPGFPKALSGLGLLYSVNSDPQRPTCLWVNADFGVAQIQSFDAFTGGTCGSGTTRVLGSQFVVPLKKCEPATYRSIQILDPAPGSYTSGSVQFADADGNPIPGAAERPLDATGTVDLSGLNLNTATGLPQFLITLTGGSGTPSQVVVKLSWEGVDDPECQGAGVQKSTTPPVVAPQPPVVAQSAASRGTPPRRCLSRRAFRIRIVSRRSDPIRSATVRVLGKKVDVVPRRIDGRRRLTATIDLGGTVRSTVAVRITAKTRSGKTKRGVRRYRTCDRKLTGGSPKL
jgi:hypothetical protein